MRKVNSVKIGSRIQKIRKSYGYTQEKMANILKISLRQYVRIDTEEDLPRRDILKDLITTLKLSNEEIGIYVRSYGSYLFCIMQR